MHVLRFEGRFERMSSITNPWFFATFLTAATAPAIATPASVDEIPLPRVREGGTPYDPMQSLVPRSIQRPPSLTIPGTGVISSPAEYEPVHGVLFRYNSASFASVVRDCVVALTSNPAYDEIAYVVVSSAAQQQSATNAFIAGGADMSKVRFFVRPTNSVWMRDYGPHFVWQDGALAVVDSHYYPTRPDDNFAPTLLGDLDFGTSTYDMGVYYSGGNFQPGPNRSGFKTALVNLDNPSSAGFDANSIATLFQDFQGIDTLHVLPQLPPSVDGTGHIDMWMYLVDADTAIISEFVPGSNATAITVTSNAVPFMQNLGFTVFRTPAFNVGSTHYTYANAFRVNDRIFIPTYGQGNSAYLDEDAAAIAAWQAAAGPGVQIVGINCFSIIPAAGAIHCIVKQVPRYTAPVPAAHVSAPSGSEILAPGDVTTITWLASDTFNAPIPTADLSWSPNDGITWFPIATVANTGRYDWTVPMTFTDRGRVRVVVTAADSDQATAQSAGSFRIVPAVRSVYDFANGAGPAQIALGTQTSSWNAAVSNVRSPVGVQLSAAAYTALATSNATGGDGDANRYISPTVSGGFESTHIFEFTLAEAREDVAALDVRWEGYADNCTQVELYVWDLSLGQWSDGRGNVGQNRYLDAFAGNRDEVLKATIASDIARYVDGNGRIAFLVYAERPSDETFHDVMDLTVTRIAEAGATFCSGDGLVTACPCGNFGAEGRGCRNSASSDGARLDAFGVARVTRDSLGLAVSGTPPLAAVLFIQGSDRQSSGAGAVFGDGLRCVAGNVIRLGLRTAIGGTARYGAPYGDEPVSTRGAIGLAGGTFHYQAWYRDPAAFCTNSTFNLSNGTSVVWAP